MSDSDFPLKSRWGVILLCPLLLGWIIAFAVALALGVSVVAAALAGVALGALAVWLIWVSATKLIEAKLGAQPADPAQHALLFSTVEALCLVNGLPNPKLVVISEPAPTALAYGIGKRRARICVSDGFFKQLKAVEQEAMVAHALCRIHRGDIWGDSFSAVIFGLVLAPVGLRPLAGRCATALRGSAALLAADLSAVRLTRYPPALVSVLETLESIATQDAPSIPGYLDHLQILPRQVQKEPARDRIGVLVEV